MSLGQALNLVNGPTIGDAIGAKDNAITELVKYERDPKQIIEELFLSFLCRFPTEAELSQLAPTLEPENIANMGALAPAGAADLLRRRTEWEDELLPLAEWQPLRPLSASSDGGAKMTVREDHSIFVEGGTPTDAYHIVVSTSTPITGLRVETLPDEALPMGGPGRNGSGNYVLSELTLSAVAAGSQDPPRVLKLQHASADYSQDGYPVENSIDGKDDTGWAVHMGYGVPHGAVYELAPEKGTFAGANVLMLRMAQNYGSDHTIGHFRISVTTSPRPVRHHGLPTDVVKALNVAPHQRTPDEEARIHTHFVTTHPDIAETIRLAASQDIAWALANSPAFLFNH